MIRLLNDNGAVNIAGDVFTNLSGYAAVNCFGVKGMAMRSLADGLVHLLKREFMGKGVLVTYNDDSTISIELHIIVNQGVNIPVLCNSIISEVRYKVTEATNVRVKTVDIFIDSIMAD